jgi:biopolymer transport protein ExbD
MLLSHFSRRSLLAALAVLVAHVAACATSAPRVFVSVHVLEDGSFNVNGKPVARENLPEVLTSFKPPGGGLDIGFQVARKATYEQVQYAMSVAQRLEASVGIVGNEKF